MLEKIRQHYLSRLHKTQQALEQMKRDIYYLGTVRLLIAIVTFVLIYFLRTQGAVVIVCVLFSGTVLFLMALQQWNRLQQRKHYLETSSVCDRNELDALDYRFDAFDGLPERIQTTHPFGLDLDIFGNHSLFQSVNRTSTVDGKQALAGWFENPLHSKEQIENRQQAIKELCNKPDFMHHFQVTGRMNRGSDSDKREIEEFISQPAYIRNKTLWRTLRIVFPSLWVIVILLTVLGTVPLSLLIVIYVITLIISESWAKTINRLQDRLGKNVAILTSYSQLIQSIEQESFGSDILLNLQSCYRQEGKHVSKIIGRLAQLAGELEQRSNIMVHLVFNPLILWDIHKTMQVDCWKENYGSQSLAWMQTLGEYDAFVSLATFAFTHPDYVYPELAADYFVLKGKNVGHPLMRREICVRNDIDMQKSPCFLIVTGANMSGKSTYLRAIGVNFVLACMGAPVCADALRVSPAALITSLRTSDSLNDNESYFFAELKRLKMIIDRLEAGEKLFIILDEILKGTNSVDKQKGSLALIQQFVRLQTCGIIATHDLLLGSLETEFPEHIKNYCFEADIAGDELSFFYRLKEGVAQNMNATFLMKKMGITL
jgi:hypothetical protein